METAGQEPLGALRRRRQVRAGRLRRPGVPPDLGQGQAPALVRQLLRGADVQQHARSAAASRSAGRNGVTFPGMPFNQQMTMPVELTCATADRRPAACSPSRSRRLSLCCAVRRRMGRPQAGTRRQPARRPEGRSVRDLRGFQPGERRAFESRPAGNTAGLRHRRSKS